jgi:heptosyltransferase-2
MQPFELKKILIIQTAFIGDVVLATPLIEALHKDFPDAQIDFLLRKGNESLLEGHPYLHNVLIWNKQENKLNNLQKIIKEVRTENYDAVFNLQRFFSSGLITVGSGAKYTVGFDKNPLSFLFTKKVKHEISATGNRHETERNLDLIRDFVPDANVKVRLYPTQEAVQKVAPYKKEQYIVIAPASVWFTKQYPALKWVELLKSLDGKYRIYLIGAPGDAALADEIIRQSERPNCINLCGQLSMPESVALMQDAAMNYVNDSAPLHFASATNAKVCAVFCSTVPQFGFGPVSEQGHIVEVKENLECRPCGLHGKKACPEGHFDCAMKIKTKDLIATLEK